MSMADKHQSKHPRAQFAAMCVYAPKVAARTFGVTVAEAKALRDKIGARIRAAQFVDPLILARQTRPSRTPTARAERDASREADRIKRQAEVEAMEQARERRDATRDSLLRAAEIARKHFRLSVRRSKDRSEGHQPRTEVVSVRLGPVQRRIMALLEGKPSGESLYGKAFAREFAGWDQEEVQRSLDSLEARGLIRAEGPLPRYIKT